MTRLDPHSYYDTTHPKTRHLEFNWFINFSRHQIEGSVTLLLEGPSGGVMDLDSKGLNIQAVYSEDKAIPYEIAEEEPILSNVPWENTDSMSLGAGAPVRRELLPRAAPGISG
jgi:hypothetical protein